MNNNKMLNYIKEVVANMPAGWLNITTHRLDIYDESQAKTQFLKELETLYSNSNAQLSALKDLPTAYDYIRLGHPLSCVLEWGVAQLNDLKWENAISFSSNTVPVLSILRKNLLEHKNTQILYSGSLPACFDGKVLKDIYGYQFELKQIDNQEQVTAFDGTTIYLTKNEIVSATHRTANIDFYITLYDDLGSILLVNGLSNETYISDIQHVRRRETIAMTPANCLTALHSLVDQSKIVRSNTNFQQNKTAVLEAITKITGSATKPLVASSGLSIQYAILMGLIDDAVQKHPGKAIKIIVPPNCYGGTNDQARRVAACIENVEIVDLLVDGDNDMVQSINTVLAQIAIEDAVPYIIAEIPTNPRVEVPNLIELKNVLSAERKTASGAFAVDPVFILDQTFCPNVHFLGENEILSSVRTISFASGSKFPSGGQCTAGYCVGNTKTKGLMAEIENHLMLCDNEATELQYEILAKQLPSMNQRIADAYKNTREFVNFIHTVLPAAKINFVSDELAEQGFTPSVFSLDLPTKGANDAEKEDYKRALNLKLIHLMITEIPDESKFCVSYGQLKGCYWTIPATSTQGTTKECDKDYIVRAALSGNMDLELHKRIFSKFVESI
ncbi:PLP-dependent aminotransferase family protein [Flavobacterium muglaense]|uniref:Cystathionine beta-synthase n=1 Tax=Flavobacterium muglaense TaxID=2764716 RepID=A0A923N082_9FLAO|nr:cystathionine beta-synthase [Flavobacterium muglaense]MBC5838272.1 cystathionine beta-synthase [Flavobacterium muglaense]MBC5844807.1 cystathionine beta-synthase [Flavobacterium muglaense]